MLQAKTEEQREYIKSLAEKESCDGDVIVCEDGITYKVDHCFYVDISFDTMKQIVEHLKFRIRKGYLYKCKKDIYDNSGKVCLFNKDESYLSPEDNMLLSNNGVRMVFQEWHKPQELFEEVDENKQE